MRGEDVAASNVTSSHQVRSADGLIKCIGQPVVLMPLEIEQSAAVNVAGCCVSRKRPWNSRPLVLHNSKQEFACDGLLRICLAVLVVEKLNPLRTW